MNHFAVMLTLLRDRPTFLDEIRRNIKIERKSVSLLVSSCLFFAIYGAIIAKDILGNPIPATQILAEAPGSRALVAGVSGEPTYLIVKEDNTLDSIGILDNCTHLGCSFPWNPMDQQFQCPCHGSRYAPDGTVVRGPAPLPLKIFHVAVVDNNILISPWTETDPRTGENPWWV